jgi:hypothetical protein
MKQKLLRPLAVVLTCGVLSGLLAGCAWSIGGEKDGTTSHQPTRGQELVDMKKARDQGAITQEEYENQKRQILAK